MGTGSTCGLLSTLVGESLPGAGPCIAVGNALMQGPLVFHLPPALVERILAGAAAGEPDLCQLELNMFRFVPISLM